MHWSNRGTGSLTAVAALTLGFYRNGVSPAAQTAGSSLGIFDNQSDVGSVAPPGSRDLLTLPSGVYTIRSSGRRICGSTSMRFHFVWKKDFRRRVADQPT